MFKFVVLCAAVAVARAGYLSSAIPAASYSSSSYSYATAPAVRYAAAAPAFSYAAPAPALRYDTGYVGAIQAAPALGYHATPAVSYTRAVHAAPAIGYTGYAAPAIQAAPLAAAAVVRQPSILRSFENLGGYAAPALSSYHGNSFGYAASPLSYARAGYAGGHGLGYAAAPLSYARAGYAGGHGLEYGAAPAIY